MLQEPFVDCLTAALMPYVSREAELSSHVRSIARSPKMRNSADIKDFVPHP